MESQQGNTLEERLGRGPQTGSVAGKFNTWTMPQPSQQQHSDDSREAEEEDGM